MIGVIVTRAVFEGRNCDHDSITIHDLGDPLAPSCRDMVHFYFSTDVLVCQEVRAGTRWGKPYPWPRKVAVSHQVYLTPQPPSPPGGEGDRHLSVYPQIAWAQQRRFHKNNLRIGCKATWNHRARSRLAPPPPHSVERGKSSVGALLAVPWAGHRPAPTKQILRSLTKVQGTSHCTPYPGNTAPILQGSGSGWRRNTRAFAKTRETRPTSRWSCPNCLTPESVHLG